MKNKIAWIVFILTIFSQSAFAAPQSIEKLTRGVEGVLTSPIEYVNEFQSAYDKHGILSSSFITVITGTGMTVKRIVNGAYDIVTFPLPYPRPYGLLLKDSSDTALQRYYDQGNRIPE